MYGCTFCNLGKESPLGCQFLKYIFFPLCVWVLKLPDVIRIIDPLESPTPLLTNKESDVPIHTDHSNLKIIIVIWRSEYLSNSATNPLPLLWQITSHLPSCNKPVKVEAGQRKTVFGRREKGPRQESGEEILVKEHYRNCRRLNFEENLVFETECLLSKRTVKIELSSILLGEAFYALL